MLRPSRNLLTSFASLGVLASVALALDPVGAFAAQRTAPAAHPSPVASPARVAPAYTPEYPATGSTNPAAERSGFFDLALGGSTLSDNFGAGLGFSGGGGYFFSRNAGVGLFLRGGTHSNGLVSLLFGGELLLQAPVQIPGATLGIALGGARTSNASFTSPSVLTYGAKLGYDFEVTQSYPITLGVDLGVYFFKPTTKTLSLVSPLLVAKWWF